MTPSDSNLLSRIVQSSVALLISITIGSYIVRDQVMAASILIGGLIAILNFVWQRRALSRMLETQYPVSTTGAAFRFVLRLSVTALILTAIIAQRTFSIPGLLIGLSCIVIVITLFTLYAAFRKGE